MPQLLRGCLSPGVPMPPLNLAFVNKVRVAFCPFFNVAACRHDVQSFPLAGACCGRPTPRAHMACAPELGPALRLRILPEYAQREYAQSGVCEIDCAYSRCAAPLADTITAT